MGHLSIALLKKELSSASKDETHFQYLVIKTDENKYQFLDYESSAINGQFDYSKFRAIILKYLDFSSEDIENGKIDFKNKRSFKISKRNPHATSYEYTLSDQQINHIEIKLKLSDTKWGNLIWMNEKQLLKVRKNWVSTQSFIFKKVDPFLTPKFSNKLRANLRNLVQSNEKRKLVIFAGSGVSLDSKVPLWSELINELKSDLDIIETDYLKVADIYLNSRGEKEYNEKVQQILNHGIAKYNPIHEKVIGLKPIHIVTTNFDDLFEQIIEEKGEIYSTVQKDSDLPYSKGDSLLIKMHGDLKQRNMVLRKSDYESYSENFPLIEGYIKGLFASKLVLFIGFSFTDPNLQQILSKVKNILKEDIQKPYILTFPSSDRNKKQEVLNKKMSEEYSLNVIEYEPIPMENYFNQVKTEEDERNIKLLSPKGKNVYTFLKVIEKFDVFSDSLNELNIEKQLTNSLLRFDELGAIPPIILESITPFKLKRQDSSQPKGNAEFNIYAPFEIKTANEDLLSFLEEKSNSENKIEFSFYEDSSIPENKQRLNKALKLLYTSNVIKISRKNDTSTISYSLVPVSKEKKCSCYKCLHDNFSFDTLLKKLNSTSNDMFCDNDSKSSLLIQAYGFFKVGQFLKAYQTLVELRSFSWKNKEYILFFLASYNLVLLRPYLWFWNDNNIDEDLSDYIKESIDNIKLDQLVYGLPVNDSIREALLIIKQERIFDSTRAYIEKEFLEIKKVYQKYRIGGYRQFGADYAFNVQSSFYKLWKFNQNNLLFTDALKKFIDLAHIYIEAMIASTCTSNEYEQRREHYSSFFVHVCLFYGSPKSINSLFDKYAVKTLSFEDSEQTTKDIIDSFNSFCNSGFKENKFHISEIQENDSYCNWLSVSRTFLESQRLIMSNFCIILQKVHLPPDTINEVVKLTLSYLEFNPIYSNSNTPRYFIGFIVSQIENISNDNVLRLLNYILSDNIHTGEIVEPVCDALINKKKVSKIVSEEFYTKLIRRSEARRKWNMSENYIVPFFALFTIPYRKKLSKHIFPKLIKNDLIEKAYDWGLWRPKKNPEVLDLYIENLLKKCKKFPDFDIKDNGLPDKINSFEVWNELHFVTHIVYRFDLFKKEYISTICKSIDSKMFKWVLKPNDFDYKHFNANWIFSFNNKVILTVLKHNQSLKNAINKELKLNFDKKLAKIYFEKLQP